MLEVLQGICAQQEAPSPMANTGRTYEWVLDRWEKVYRNTIHMPTNNITIRTTICHAGTASFDHRYSQFRPYTADRK